MPWVPLAASGLTYTLTQGDSANLSGSTVTANGASNRTGFALNAIGSAAQIRATINSYSVAAEPDFSARFTWGSAGSPTVQQNSSATPMDEFTPNPIVGTVPAGGLFSYTGPSFSFGAQNSSYSMLLEVWSDSPVGYSDPHNCDCDTGTEGNETRATLRTRLLSMLGYGAQDSNPPPGMAELLNNFLDMAQRKLYTRLTEYGWVRFFNWPLVEGVYLFDVPDNIDGCPRKLNPRKIQWVGIHKDGIYRPLAQGIDPSLYSHDIMAQWPTRYEIRQCIEIWPKPSSDGGYLVIKGGFGLDPFNTDSSVTTVKSDLVFLQALADAKAHYRKPDAGNIQQQVEVMLSDIVAGGHMTARYIPGRGRSTADPGWAYDWPVATPPFPVS